MDNKVLLYTHAVFMHAHIYSDLCIGQNLGQNLVFREKFDIAVARAVAEMRVLGKYYSNYCVTNL